MTTFGGEPRGTRAAVSGRGQSPHPRPPRTRLLAVTRKRRLALTFFPLVGVVALAGAAGATISRPASALVACPAARVHHEPNEQLGDLSGSRWIATSPRSAGIIGQLWGGEETDGRVTVYAGGENPIYDTAEKVLWIVDAAKRVGSALRIVGGRVRVTRQGRVRPTRGSFRLTLHEASSEQTPGHLFPSIIGPPRAGCWRLTLRSGRLSARVIIRALPVPAG